MADNKRDCQFCGGSGTVITNLIERSKCQYCNGTGELDVKEKRKSILVSVPTHKLMRDMAYERKLSHRDYVTKLIRDDVEKWVEEL